MKYFLGLFLVALVIMTVSYWRGVLPPNTIPDPNADFVELSSPPTEVGQLLKRACYNCHSAQANYPQIAHYAPYHKKYVKPVTLGRQKLNFSSWSSYSPEMQKVLLLIAVEQMENKTMPITGVFSDGMLAQKEKELLMHWLAQEAEAGMEF